MKTVTEQLRTYLNLVTESRQGEIDIDFTDEAIKSGIAKKITNNIDGRRITLYLVPVQGSDDGPRLAKIKLAFRGAGQPFDIMIGIVSSDGRFNFTKNDLVKIFDSSMSKPVLNTAQQTVVKAGVLQILKPRLS